MINATYHHGMHASTVAVVVTFVPTDKDVKCGAVSTVSVPTAAHGGPYTADQLGKYVPRS